MSLEQPSSRIPEGAGLDSVCSAHGRRRTRQCDLAVLAAWSLLIAGLWLLHFHGHRDDAGERAALHAQAAGDPDVPSRESLPAGASDVAQARHLWMVSLGFAGVWLVGSLGIVVIGRRMGRRIAERDLAEAVLRESEQRFRSVIETSPDAIAVMDLDGRFVMANKRAAVLAGFGASDDMIASGTNAFGLLEPDDQQRVRDDVRELIRSGGALKREYCVVRHDKTRFPIEVHASLLKDADGNAKGLVTTIRDITERRQAEEAIERERIFNEAVLDSVPGLLYLYDEQGNLIRWNRQHEELTGYSADELRHMHILDWYHGDRVQMGAVSEASQRAFREGYSDVEANLITKSGEAKRFYFTGVRLVIDGKTYITGIGIDITERQRAEEQRRRLELQILQAQKLESLGILAGGIAHDFNNILAGIIGYTELALADLPDADRVEASLGIIKKASQRAADLVRQMLAYSGKGQFVVGPVNLSAIVEELRPMLAVSISKKAVLHYDLRRDLPAIEADATQMRQVVMNLVINASESLGEDDGAVSVSTDVVCYGENVLTGLDENGTNLPAGTYVRLTVVDNGCGIDEATLKKIFEPFFSTKFTGRGLGLAAVHGIVRSQRGTIQVASQPGKGTTFAVFFPARDATSV